MRSKSKHKRLQMKRRIKHRQQKKVKRAAIKELKAASGAADAS